MSFLKRSVKFQLLATTHWPLVTYLSNKSAALRQTCSVPAEEDARFAKSNDTFAFVLSQFEEASCDWIAFGNRRAGINATKPYETIADALGLAAMDRQLYLAVGRGSFMVPLLESGRSVIATFSSSCQRSY